MQIRKILLTAAVLVGIHSAKAQDTLYLDLEKCRAMALENSEKVQIAGQTLEKVKGEKMAARATRLPNFSASATGVYKNIDFQQELYLPTQSFDLATGTLQPNIAVNPVTGEPIIGTDGNPVFNTYAYLPLDVSINGLMMAGVSAQQPLYAGGRISAGNRMADIGEVMAEKNKGLQKAQVVYETDQAYYQFLSVKAKVELAKNYRNLLQKIVDVVNDSYETGMTNRNELLKVQVKYNEAALGLQQAETGLKLSRMVLCRAIGLPMDADISVNDTIDSAIFDAGNIEPFLAENRVEYQLLKSQADMAQENVKLVRGDYLPTAGVSVNYNYTLVGISGQGLNKYDNLGLSAMGNIKIPIFHFNEGRGKVAAAKADYSIKQLELQQTRELLQLEIEQACLNYADAFTRVEMADDALRQAAENMRVSDDNYELGMETLVNLLEAKAGWQKAFSNKIDALTDLKIKESNYLRISNQLLKE